ncbi:flagellar hook-length control protein FliK [Neptunomonas antarctica]|nr:flagellar hook-length control protein FliK [Neptunomonas antarctica]
MNTIVPQSLSLLDSSGNTRTGSSDKLIPPGQSLQATVRQVSQDKLSPNVFRLKLEANSLLMELKVQQPIAQGSQVILSRSNNGQLSVQLSTPAPTLNTASAAQTTNTNATASDKVVTTRTYQIAATPVIRSERDLTTLERLVPSGQTINARVISQTPAATSTPAPIPALTPLPLQTGIQQQTPTQPLTQPQTTTQPQLTAQIPTPAQPAIKPIPQPQSQSIYQPQSSTLSSAIQAHSPIQQPSQMPSQFQTQPQIQTQPTSPIQTPAQPAIKPAVQPQNLVQQATQLQTQAPSQQASPTQHSSNQYRTVQLANTMTLNIKGESIVLQTTANPPPLQQVMLTRGSGEQLTIRWSQPVSSPQPSLTQPLTPPQTQTVETSFREFMPQQIPLSSGIQQLLNSTQMSNTTTAGHIDKVVQSLLQLFGVQPGAMQAQQAIKQNIHFGGLFTENKLAQNKPVNKDIKQFLGKIQSLSEQLPADQKQIIQATVSKMLAGITTNQLSTVQQRQDRIESNERFFQLDLPIQNQQSLENVELHISQRNQKNTRGEVETLWTVRLHFELEQEGSIDADLSLNEEQNELTASFTCSQQETVTSIKNQLDQFKKQLNTLGLQVPTLVCKQGQHRARTTPIHKQLIDIKT